MASPSLADLAQAYLDLGQLSPIYLGTGLDELDTAANVEAFRLAVAKAADSIGYDAEAAQRDMQALWDLENDENLDLHSLDLAHLQALRVFAVHDAGHGDGYEQVAAGDQVEAIDVAIAEVDGLGG